MTIKITRTDRSAEGLRHEASRGRDANQAGRLFGKPLEPFSRTSRTCLCRTKTEIEERRPETAVPESVSGGPEFEELPA
jgi:hypothetical protein